MVKQVHEIWSEADCPPKSLKSMKKMYNKLILEKKVLVKNKKKYEIRKFDESFDL